MDTYTLVGFNSFTSKKGNPTTVLYVTYPRQGIQGIAAETIFCSSDRCPDDLWVGAELHIFYDRSGKFPQQVSYA